MRVTVLCLLVGVTVTFAQQPSPIFKAGIDLVQVDVSVFDKNRRPVRGLSAADFTILEDGKPQAVVAFFAVDAPDPAAPAGAWAAAGGAGGPRVTWVRDVAPDVQTNDPAAGRLMVLFIDDALIPEDPKIIENARRIARNVIDRLGPADRLSVVFSRGGRPAQNFTGDRARLAKAIADIQGGSATYQLAWDTAPGPESYTTASKTTPVLAPRPCGTDHDIQARDGSVNTLESVAETLIASPERRKALVYVSPGVPVGVTAGGAIGPSHANDPPPGSTPDFAAQHQGCAPVLANREADVALSAILPELFRRMQRANVVIYPIDPSGPNGLRNFIEHQLAGVPAMQFPIKAPLGADGSLTKDAVPTPGDLANFQARLDLDFLETAAANTGGHAIVNTEDFDTGIAQIFAESGSYYLLGYRAPADNNPGTLHRLKVTVNRPGVEARTRSGYFTPEPEKVDVRNPSASPTKKALEALLPSADLPLQVALAPVAIPGKDEAAVTVVLGLQHASESKPINDAVAVEVRAFTPDGARRGTQVQEAFLAVRPSATAEIVHYEALSSINLKPGRYQLRIAAYSGANDAAGSVFADLDVPDFAKEPVSLSGVLVTATPALPASPLDAFKKIVPVVPTAARVFQKLDRVTAFVRLYQAAKGPVTGAALAVRVTNERGELLVNTTEAFAPDRFAGAARSMDYRFELPMLTLTRGPYLLTFEASVGAASARRDVRFVVK
jgi:VWFA-related protein